MEKIKALIKRNINKRIIIKTDTDKKKCESFECIVKEMYRSIFVVQVTSKKDKDNVKTFSYNDIYSKLIEVVEVPE